MDRYLLGTQALREFLSKSDNPITYWANNDNTVFDEQVYISPISLGEIKDALNRLDTNDASRTYWSRAITEGEKFFQHRGNIIPVTIEVTDQWVKIRPLEYEGFSDNTQKVERIGEDRKLVLATAMAHNMILVESRQPYHDDLIRRGLIVVDPYSDLTA